MVVCPPYSPGMPLPLGERCDLQLPAIQPVNLGVGNIVQHLEGHSLEHRVQRRYLKNLV